MSAIKITTKLFSNVTRENKGNKNVFYSYKVPIITLWEVNGVKKIKITEEKYSQTTSKHVGKVLKFLGVKREEAQIVKQEKIDSFAQSI